MARSHDNDDGGDEERRTPLLYRRGLLTAAGAGAFAGITGLTGRVRAAESVIDLGDEGLQDGDDVTPYIDQYFRSGNEVHIPAGSYRLSSHKGLQRSLSNAALIGSDDGVEFHRPSDPEHQIRPFVKATGGTVRIENITIRGTKGQAQSRWRFDAVDPDARVEVVNVNHPDGSVNCSDSFAFYVGRHHEGTVHFKNCYVANMGNSSFYINQGFDEGRNNPIIMENCVVINANGTSRHGTNGAQIRDCTFVWRDEPRSWTNCSSLARGPRWDQGGEDMVVENCHFCFESDIGSSEGAMKFEDWPLGGDVRDIFIHNETSGEMFRDAGGLDKFTFENVHITGPGRTISSTVSGVKHETPPDLRNENAVWMPESETVKPQGGSSSGDSGSTDEPEGSMFEVVATDSDAELTYAFDVDGTAVKAEASEQNSSLGEANDTVTDNGDGTVTVEGKTGFGLGDAFLVTGAISNFERTSGDSTVQLILDGEDVTDQFADGGGSSSPQRVFVDGTTAPEEVNAYEIEVTGEIESDPENTTTVDGGLAWDSLEDSVDGSTVVGVVGNGVDAYTFTGDIVTLTVDGDAATRVED